MNNTISYMFGNEYKNYDYTNDLHANDIYIIDLEWIDNNHTRDFDYILPMYNLKLLSTSKDVFNNNKYEVEIEGTKKDIIYFIYKKYDLTHNYKIKWKSNGYAIYIKL